MSEYKVGGIASLLSNNVVEENVPELPEGTDIIVRKDKKAAPPTRRVNLVGKKLSAARKKEIKSSEDRTLFVGNVPADAKTRTLKHLFDEFGAIEAVYARSLIQKNEKLTEKMIHTDKTKKIAAALTTKNVFVRFEKAESAQAAAKKMNGHLFEGHNLRVSVSTKHEFGHARTIFVGNLVFEATDQAVHDFFTERCGEVETVRLIRDRITGRTTGIGYVAFKDYDSVLAALKLDGVAEFRRRKLRISKLLKKNQRPAGTKRFSHVSYKDAVKNPGFKKRAGGGVKAAKGEKFRSNRTKASAENSPKKEKKIADSPSTFVKKDETPAAGDADRKKKKKFVAKKRGDAKSDDGDATKKALSKTVRKVIKKRHNAKKSKSIMN